MTSFTLPWPPSVNNYLVPTPHGRPALSARARAYRTEVGWACRMQRVKRWESTPVSITLDAHPPDRRTRDIDNILKQALDALEAARVVDDDKHIHRIEITRREPDLEHQGSVRVRIEAWDPE